MAVTVNREMISPLYCGPPRLVRYSGNSGISMLKLAKKSSELTQSSQNCGVYIFDLINRPMLLKYQLSNTGCIEISSVSEAFPEHPIKML